MITTASTSAVIALAEPLFTSAERTALAGHTGLTRCVCWGSCWERYGEGLTDRGRRA